MEAAPNREHIRNMAEARAHVKRDGGCYIRPSFSALHGPSGTEASRHNRPFADQAQTARSARNLRYRIALRLGHDGASEDLPPGESSAASRDEATRANCKYRPAPRRGAGPSRNP